MTVSAKMILDSSAHGERLTSIEARYPKFIHGELMTHRVFSRNASSSRAIPVERLIEDVLRDPALPEKWFKNKAGMQGTEEIVGDEREELIGLYLEAMRLAIRQAREMIAFGAHKQHINRIIEPFCHITTLITSTQWSNFIALRDHDMADPTMQALGKTVRKALATSLSTPLEPGQWHLPYVMPKDAAPVIDYLRNDKQINPTDERIQKVMIQLSVARAARVSYKLQDGMFPTIAKDLELYDRLVGGVPLHASPAEHQATPSKVRTDLQDRPILCGAKLTFVGPNLGGNLGPGWIQYRKTLAGECQ